MTIGSTPPEASGLALFDLAGALDEPENPPTVLRRADGRGLVYAASVNWLSGEPGGGKTWLADAAVGEVAMSGGVALILDYEDTPATAARRLRALGVDAEGLSRVVYLRGAGSIEIAGLAWLAQLVRETPVDLVVIDSAPESLAAEGLEENSSTDVTRWVSRLPRRLARAGAAVLVLDHVVKRSEEQGRWARGSSAKLAAVDGVAYGLTLTVPFSRSSSGAGTLTVAKDRPGHVGPISSVAAVARFEVSNGGERLRVVLDEPAEAIVGQGRPPLPTEAMEAISRLLEAEGDMAEPRILDRLGPVFGRDRVRTARVALVKVGAVAEVRGPRGGARWRSVAPWPPGGAAKGAGAGQSFGGWGGPGPRSASVPRAVVADHNGQTDGEAKP
ncbi:MAG: AAA family ATPase [Acidimicrobiales bacterium]